MVDRNYSLPTLDKSEHHLLGMCRGSGSEWGEREGGREGGRESGRKGKRERGGGGGEGGEVPEH